MREGLCGQLIVVLLFIAFASPVCRAQDLQALVVAPENRCQPYDQRQYRYPQSVEARIVRAQGNRIYGPYTGRYFRSTRETDIEHIVARSEAHDSGLCAASAARKRQFSADLLNLTLAAPQINRADKSAKDAGQWLPAQNRCWFAGRVVMVKQKYRLTVDAAERDALAAVLEQCQDTNMVYTAAPAVSAPPPSPSPSSPPSPPADRAAALIQWDDNNNGRISCAEARRHGIAPVLRQHPAYAYMTDRNNDGIVCN